MSRTRYYDSDNPGTVVRGASWRVGLWIIVVIVFFGLLGGGIWAINVATSGVKGSGNVVIKNNDANNRIDSQAYFETLNGDITSYTTQLTLAVAQVAKHPGDDFYETNFTGLYNTCVSAVNDYNAASAKTLFQDWKTADLPETIAVGDACPSTEK